MNSIFSKFPDLDFVSELEVIADKKSKLTKSERDDVSKLIAYGIGNKCLENLIVYSVGNFFLYLEKEGKFKIQNEFKPSETWKGIVTRFVAGNDVKYVSNEGYCKISPIEALSFSYNYFKIMKSKCTENGLNSLKNDDTKKIYNGIAENMKAAQEFANSDKKLSKLVSNNLIY